MLHPKLRKSIVSSSLVVFTLTVVLTPKPARADWWDELWDTVGDVCGSLCPEQSVPGVSAPDTPKYQTYISDMPYMEEFQGDDANCGPHSAARVLRWLGYDYENGRGSVYQQLRSRRQAGLNFPGGDSLGTTPHFLHQVIGEVTNEITGSRADVHLERNASFNRMKEVLMSGKPVIALVRNGTGGTSNGWESWEDWLNAATPTYPLLHWIVVIGFDDNAREVYFMDTTDNVVREIPYNSFLASTAGASDYTWTWEVGRGGVNTALRNAGVTSSTFLWIDQQPGVGGSVDDGQFGESSGGGMVDYGNGAVPSFNLGE
jgi:hypothetical protein